jgi:glycolate oxidase FAD binding subunit
MTMPHVLRPRDAADVAEIVRAAAGALEPRGGGSKRNVGRIVDATVLELAALDAIVDYSPAELVLTARAATPLAAIDAALRAHGQRLAFEPPDFAVLLGSRTAPTLGGVLAANAAGSRRLHAGAARDHFLGFAAVDGRGAPFKAGGRVVKNVTGYDLPKVLAGSWGTLAVLTEVTVRVAPSPEIERTLAVRCSRADRALEIMTAALSAPLEVSSAAYDPAQGCLLRLEGFAASVEARAAALRAIVAPAELDELDTERSRDCWRALGAAAALADWPIVWRISVPPADGARVLERLAPEQFLLDWGGGLIWAAYRELDAFRVRNALDAGHATLFKAPPAARTGSVAVFHPQPPTAATLTTRLKAAFDPRGVLNPGRMS